jgi:hypothetical protein
MACATVSYEMKSIPRRKSAFPDLSALIEEHPAHSLAEFAYMRIGVWEHVLINDPSPFKGRIIKDSYVRTGTRVTYQGRFWLSNLSRVLDALGSYRDHWEFPWVVLAAKGGLIRFSRGVATTLYCMSSSPGVPSMFDSLEVKVLYPT